MKGCLSLPFKFIVFFVQLIIFQAVISVHIGPKAPLSLKKNHMDLTGKERVEINNYREEEMFALGNSFFIAFPLTIFITHLIFRKKND